MGAIDTLINGSITVPTVGHRCQVCPKLAFGLSVHSPIRGCNNALTFAAYPQPTPNTVASSPKFRNSTIKRQRTIVCLGAKGVGMCLLLCLFWGSHVLTHACHVMSWFHSRTGKSSTLQQYCGEEFSESMYTRPTCSHNVSLYMALEMVIVA